MSLRIRQVLNVKRLTVKGCAEVLGLSERALSNKLAGRTDFTYREVRLLKTILPEYDIEYLLSEDTTTQDSA